MDYKTLIDEIAARVSAKLAETEENVSEVKAEAPAASKPRILVLTEAHGTVCHKILDDAALKEAFIIDCALSCNYECDVKSYAAVVTFDLTADNICRLAGGVCDTPFSSLARMAFMLGKKIYSVKESIELFKFADTMPHAYSRMLTDKLALLEESGLVVCPADILPQAILGCHTGKPCQHAAEETVAIDKRVVSERDVASLYKQGLACIRVGERSIVTDLAREYAAARGVKIVRS